MSEEKTRLTENKEIVSWHAGIIKRHCDVLADELSEICEALDKPQELVVDQMAINTARAEGVREGFIAGLKDAAESLHNMSVKAQVEGDLSGEETAAYDEASEIFADRVVELEEKQDDARS